MTAPDYIFPLVGYRVWQWDQMGLKSLNEVRWHPREPFTAECKTKRCQEAPRSDCTCGVYAAKTLDHLRRIGYKQDRIHGAVCLWGRVVEHEGGWRAQFAYPKNLLVPLSVVPLGMHGVESWLPTFGAYGCDIFIVDGARTVPLWRKESDVDANGLDLILERCRAWYARRAEQFRLKRGDRVAVRGHGIAVVERADNDQVQAVLGNTSALNIDREEVVWDRRNMRWETAVGASIRLTARKRGY